MTAHSQTVPQGSQAIPDGFGHILEHLHRHGLTVAPMQTQRPDISSTIHDLVPNVQPFSGSYEQDGITIDEWRIRMRLRLGQIKFMPGNRVDEEFKANYVLSMLTGQAFRWVEGKFIHKHQGGNPCAGYSHAGAMLEAICDMIRDRIEKTESGNYILEKTGF